MLNLELPWITTHLLWTRRIPVSQIPQDAEGCSNWVYDLYREKDEIYDYFVNHGTFEGRGLPRTEIARNYYDLLIELSWMLIIGVPSLIYLLNFLWTSSFLAQLVVILLICLGKKRTIRTHRNNRTLYFSNRWRPSNDRSNRN